MKKYLISILIMILVAMTGLIYIQSQIKAQNNNIVTYAIEPEEYQIETPEPINPEVVKLMDITGWSEEIARCFIYEANLKNISVFEESLPVVAVETGKTYRFDLISQGNYGAFQINSGTYNYIIKQLKADGREFDYDNRLDPELNIAAGMYWLWHLKYEEMLENKRLFTSYNRGIGGANRYYSDYGTYESGYSRAVYRMIEEYKNY